MGMPRKLKHLNLFNDGISYVGEVEEVTLPKLARKMEEWRGGGMNAPIDADQGQEKLELDWTCGGLMEDALKQFGVTTHNGVMLRFAGSYQRDNSETVTAVEIVVRGRHKEIEMGGAKEGEGGKFKVKSSLSYYKLTIDGADVIEIDVENMIEIVNGVDHLAPHRQAIGI
ncbi:MAG: phage major tail tube protein [Marinobacterium sp.]|nr:phage major tail tube protein [Marinobacterium sp.]